MILEITISSIILLITYCSTRVWYLNKKYNKNMFKKRIFRKLTPIEKLFFAACNKGDLNKIKELFGQNKIDPNI